MFKKNTWIAGLLAALTMMFVGCIDSVEEDNSGEMTDVFVLSEFIKDLPDGVVDYDAVFGTVSPIAKCGSPVLTIITEGGVKKLKIDGMTQTWGEGIDIRHATDASNVGVGFKTGDELYVKGTSNPSGVMFNPKGESYGKIENYTTEASFDKSFILSADDVASIRGNGKGIRIHYDDGQGDGRKGVIVFEEIRVTGLRNAGEGPEPPVTDDIDGAGAYKVPAATISDFYLDLNQARNSVLSASKPVAKIEADKLTFTANQNTQAIFIPFTDEVKSFVQSAYASGFSFNVTIDGSADKPASWIRWCIGANRTGSWNLTTLTVDNDFNVNDGTRAINQVGTAANAGDMNGFILQARPDGAVTDPIADPYKITIKSIKFTITGSGTPLKAVSSVSFTLDNPYPGFEAPTSVDGGTEGYRGTITWSPAPINGKFQKLTVYKANIALSAKLGYYIDTEVTSYEVNGNDAAYTPATQTVSYVFPQTRQDDDILFSPLYQGTKLTVKVDNASRDVAAIAAVKGSFGYKTGNSGYIFRADAGQGGYGNEYVKFQVNLNEPLSNFASVKFTFKGISGDVGWKSIFVYASVAEPTGYINISGENNVAVGNYANDGLSEQTFELELNETRVALVAGNTLWFIINIHSNAACFEISDIEFIKDISAMAEYQGTKLTVKVDGVNQDTTVSPVSGVTAYLTANNGFVFRATPSGGYGNEYPLFEVDFGAGSLADFAKIKFTFKGVSGDVGWKTLFVRANATKPSGYWDPQTTAIASYKYDSGATASNGLTPMELELTITTANAPAGNKLWFTVNPRGNGASGGVPTTWEVYNIEFIK